MILYELLGSEDNPIYQRLEIENADRQLTLVCSLIEAAISARKVFLSQSVIKALNYHAIACLHTNAGEYRPCEVTVGVYTPPRFWQLQALLDDFVNVVNRSWDAVDPIGLAAYVYWKINNIHPFINGNGRTARVVAYYVLCLKNGGLLKGTQSLPGLLKREKRRCCDALQHAHETAAAGQLDLTPLIKIFEELIEEQMKSDLTVPDTAGK